MRYPLSYSHYFEVNNKYFSFQFQDCRIKAQKKMGDSMHLLFNVLSRITIRLGMKIFYSYAFNKLTLSTSTEEELLHSVSIVTVISAYRLLK